MKCIVCEALDVYMYATLFSYAIIGVILPSSSSLLPHRKPAVSIPTEYIMRIEKNESMGKKLSSSSNNNPIKMWFGLWRWFALWFILELLVVWVFSLAFVQCSTKQPPNTFSIDRYNHTWRWYDKLYLCLERMHLCGYDGFIFIFITFFSAGLYCVCIIRFALYVDTCRFLWHYLRPWQRELRGETKPYPAYTICLLMCSAIVCSVWLSEWMSRVSLMRP